MEKVMGLKIIIQVEGFANAKSWMYDLIRAGVVTCSSCDKPATRIWWNDAAEWYFECGEHYTTAPMWTGSTRWNPSSFSKEVIPGLVQNWIATLPAEDQKRIRLEEYDATDYYSMLIDDHHDHEQEIVISGNAEWGTVVVVYPLKDGRFAYDVELRKPRCTYSDGLFAPFESVDAAVADARARKNL